MDDDEARHGELRAAVMVRVAGRCTKLAGQVAGETHALREEHAQLARTKRALDAAILAIREELVCGQPTKGFRMA
jgi:hypothetical protein